MTYIESVFRWHAPNARTEPLIKAANHDYDETIAALQGTAGVGDPIARADFVRSICRKYALQIVGHMGMVGGIGPISAGLVQRDIASASMVLVSSFFMDSDPPGSARVEYAQLLLLQARVQAVAMICAADAGAVFG